jgi:hypothetical protein
MNVDGFDRTCSTFRGNEKYEHNFGEKSTRRCHVRNIGIDGKM